MEYISVSQFAEKYGISERTARNYCATGKIAGAFLTGKTWTIPSEAVLPKRGKKVVSPLLVALREQKESRMKGGIYHRVQIDLTYNSNHIEGSQLSKEQTRYIFETNTLGVTTENMRIDDILETVNHFRQPKAVVCRGRLQTTCQRRGRGRDHAAQRCASHDESPACGLCFQQATRL